MSDEARLADLGSRIDACIKRHGFTREELLGRHMKRSMAVHGWAKKVCTVIRNADGTYSRSEWRSA